MFLIALASPEVGLAHHLLYGAGGETQLHPVTVAAMVVGIVLMFVLPKRHVLAPLLFLSIMATGGQMLIIGPMHLQVPRILLIFGWARVLFGRFFGKATSTKFTMNSVDKTVILYSVVTVICYTLLWQESGAFINEAGKSYSILGFYFLFRLLITSKEDVERAIKVLAFIAIVIAILMINEQLTGQNVLAAFGGVPERTAVRGDYLRSQGPFTVYLTAGAFGATMLPLMLCLWKKGSRTIAVIGILASISIAITSRTSTAITACLAAVIGIGMWILRDKMRYVRRSIVAILVSLHLVMKAPVWALLEKVDIVGGSTGWQRFKIVDNFIVHFWDWCLLGSNNYWTWEGGDDMWDTANQYVAVGETSGLLSLVFFMAAVVYCFKFLGRARRAAGQDRQHAWFLGCLAWRYFPILSLSLEFPISTRP